MHASSAAPAACENCATPLQGGYCHACGQHAVNPMRHFAHAVEEVFESFWHLDSRVFRTMRDLFVPGRVACNYLAGQRVRYIAPLRLFVILTLLTFFVGQFAAALGTDPDGAQDDARRTGRTVEVEMDGGAGRSIQKAATEVEVQAALAQHLAELAQARKAAAGMPFVGKGLDQAEQDVRRMAERRIAQLRAQGRPAAPGSTSPDATAPASTAAAPGAARTERAAAAPASAKPIAIPTKAGEETESPGDGEESTRRGLQQMAASIGTLRDRNAVWHERDNPVDVAWLPAFMDRALNQRFANVARNTERINREGESTVFKLMLAAVPPALFVLVPVFALLLRGLYPFTPRGYLEHLVVALYSHAFMLVVLLATFVLILVRASAPAGWIIVGTNVVQGLMWLAVPVYLFVMQQRVYGQHWLATLGKYLVLGFAYLMLVMMVAVYSAFAGISSGA